MKTKEEIENIIHDLIREIDMYNDELYKINNELGTDAFLKRLTINNGILRNYSKIEILKFILT